MTYPIDTSERRRSQRIPKSIPLLVRCLDPLRFVGHQNTVEVSSHGCVIHALRPFPRGTRLRLDVLSGARATTARVVHSDPIGTGMHLTTWTVALELDKPGNVWMVNPPPPDWSKTQEQQRNKEHPPSGSNSDTISENQSIPF